ncbi:MAG: HAD-IIB family hydrolase, partial [Proteobacteria bacterium]
MSASSNHLIQLVLSDMDGTLLMPDHSLSPAVIEAVAQLRAAGVKFTLASSRPPRAMRQQIEALGIDLPTAAFNGGVLINADGSELQSHWVDREAVDICLALFAEHALDEFHGELRGAIAHIERRVDLDHVDGAEPPGVG